MAELNEFEAAADLCEEKGLDGAAEVLRTLAKFPNVTVMYGMVVAQTDLAPGPSSEPVPALAPDWSPAEIRWP